MIDPAARRRNSRRMVFDLIRERQKLSRAQLARETNMSFPTVMKVVDEFIAKGLLRELEEIEPMDGAGRRGHMLKFEPGGLPGHRRGMRGPLCPCGHDGHDRQRAGAGNHRTG